MQDTRKQTYDQNKLVKRLQRQVGQAITDFNMIEEGDRVMVCLSGGKDSYAMLDILLALRARAPIHFDLIAVNLDQKQPGFPEHVLPQYLSSIEVEYKIVEEDTYSIVTDKIPAGKTTCSLCSRLRRGILYRTAAELGATKIALGHHLDDMVETLFLNMFHGARLKSMPPKLVSDDKKNIVIRPMAYCRESDIARFAQLRAFPIIPCNLCGSQENLQRKKIKQMLHEWDLEQPGRVVNVFKSLSRVTSSHLMDRALFDFAGLSTESADQLTELDTAFDASPMEALLQRSNLALERG
ncbi:tRNA 2-thiocytidine biosynthesis protein TtcA [Arenicella chitinivorans]|uniref:tRNA-cytidine(32) 2-sulfurtransferase n=1 Tax=Arenicella chitinivorans TaxID=1329800 RepID=A0A918VRA3_9GAMM|nr:tRNA 2-thiocytidine(32) synthetase TtcA [Arenicella chitinivorans]GHA15963.1 tRNA 2-thiocytidine biosynthesis protein TtcA [Arenicella chitinivorans]